MRGVCIFLFVFQCFYISKRMQRVFLSFCVARRHFFLNLASRCPSRRAIWRVSSLSQPERFDRALRDSSPIVSFFFSSSPFLSLLSTVIFSNHLGKPHAVDNTTHHRLSHVGLEVRGRLHQIFRRFAIQRVARVWIDKQKQQTKNDARDRLHRTPIFAQNVQTNVPLRV